jgi:hypothetical protein
MARGREEGSNPSRQVGRGRWAMGPEGAEDNADGPQNDDWINGAYERQAGPNPNTRAQTAYHSQMRGNGEYAATPANEQNRQWMKERAGRS